MRHATCNMLASLCQGEARQRQILDLLCRYVNVGLCVHTSALELGVTGALGIFLNWLAHPNAALH